jgi:LysM repeat protein
MLQAFYEEQQKALDLSNEHRQKFLASYLALSSKDAAIILLQTDREYVHHKLSDMESITLLNLVQDEPALCQMYSLELLESSRSEKVWRYAKAMLAKSTKKDNLASLSREEVLAQFGKKVKKAVAATAVAKSEPTKKIEAKKIEHKSQQKAKAAVVTAPKQSAKKQPAKKLAAPKTYVVQQGDNLWRIAKKFHVDIAKLKELNHLESNALKPGSTLQIPN